MSVILSEECTSLNEREPLCYAIAKYDYEPLQEDEIKLTKGVKIKVFKKSQDSWWHGVVGNDKPGWFPSTHAIETFELGANANKVRKLQAHQDTHSSHVTVLQETKAVYSFTAKTEEHLSFFKGEELDIIDHSEEDPYWWMARNSSGNTGLIPRNYVHVTKALFKHPSNAHRIIRSPQLLRSSIGCPESVENANYDNQPWFHGKATRGKTERLLAFANIGDFLIRESVVEPVYLCVSLRGVDDVKHFKLSMTAGQFSIGGESTFETIHELIEFYMTNLIFASDDERLCLVRALPRSGLLDSVSTVGSSNC